jgi:hypothetical protein
MNGRLSNPSIVINSVTIEPVSDAAHELGPSREQRALLSKLKANKTGFQEVWVNIFPPEVWSTTDEARAYFGKFDAITLAKVGEALPQASAFPERTVLFKYNKNRHYPDSQTMLAKQIHLVYRDGAFELPENNANKDPVWYATDNVKGKSNIPYTDQGDISAKVRYKGQVIDIKKIQEVFDPETGNILQFRSSYTNYPLR